ncbi:MAG: hypothetical protein WA894_06560 [Candidatus Acidiferrum sp.]
MLRFALIALILASPVFAQDTSSNPLTAAGCGPNEVRYDVKTSDKQHPTSQPDAGKALVYVIGDSWSDHVAIHIGTPPMRFGVDGTWQGANGYRSYFFFQVTPGDHRLCTNAQSIDQRVFKSSTAAISFTAEAGKSYYFRTKSPEAALSYEGLKLVPVDPAEALVLISSASYSTFHIKK